MMFGDFRAEQHATRAPSARSTSSNGGVQIQRGFGGLSPHRVGAGARRTADAQAAADGVRLVIEGSRVRVTGANLGGFRNSVQSWSVQLIVTAPDGRRLRWRRRTSTGLWHA